MKNGLIALSLVVASVVTQRVSAQTQTAENMKSCAAFEAADKRLNAAYQKVLTANKKNTLFLTRFRAAQRAWVVFRDAEMEAVFPAKDKRLEYGSAFPMCDCDVRAELTTKRAERLEGWLNAQEGDVCAGSQTVAGQKP